MRLLICSLLLLSSCTSVSDIPDNRNVISSVRNVPRLASSQSDQESMPKPSTMSTDAFLERLNGYIQMTRVEGDVASKLKKEKVAIELLRASEIRDGMPEERIKEGALQQVFLFTILYNDIVITPCKQFELTQLAHMSCDKDGVAEMIVFLARIFPDAFDFEATRKAGDGLVRIKGDMPILHSNFQHKADKSDL